MSDCQSCGESGYKKVRCANCGHEGCVNCMLFSEGFQEYFCDTAGPDDCRKPKHIRLLISECRIEFANKFYANPDPDNEKRITEAYEQNRN